MPVLRLRVVAVILCLLTACSICNAQVIQCPTEVEVTEDGGTVQVCASADLSGVPDSEEWNITTIDDADAIAEMDYVRMSITVQAQSSGLTATVCIDVTILDDTEYEGREEFSVVFTLVASGDSCTSQVEITDFEDLQDCRQPTEMSFAEDDGIVEVCVNLTGNIYAGLVVEDGTATGGGVDYASSNGVSVRITNRIEICARVNITNDTEPENTETLAVRFIQGSSGNPLRCALTVEVQILDNDGPATIMPTETITSPPLSGAHCSEEEYVFLTEGGTLATPARVCMSFNGDMPEVDRIAIVTEDDEHLISTPPTMGMDSGELCVEIVELPDSIPEFNVTFYLVDPQANVRCPVKIIDETDEPTPNQPPTNASDNEGSGSEEDPTSPLPSEEEGESVLYIGVAVGGGVLCILIIVTTITIAAICVRRKKQAREMQHEVVDTEYADIGKTTQRKKVAIDAKVNVAYAISGHLIRINDNTAYGVTSGHNEPYYDNPQMQELVYDYPAL